MFKSLPFWDVSGTAELDLPKTFAATFVVERGRLFYITRDFRVLSGAAFQMALAELV